MTVKSVFEKWNFNNIIAKNYCKPSDLPCMTCIYESYAPFIGAVFDGEKIWYLHFEEFFLRGFFFFTYLYEHV